MVYNEKVTNRLHKMKEVDFMGKIKKAANEVLEILERYPIAAVKAFAKEAGKKLGDTWSGEKELRKKLKQMSDDELAAIYVPDVYQKDIYSIDYETLRVHGIKLITFDIDDTIVALDIGKPLNTVKVLFDDLRRMGIVPMLLTNNADAKGKSFAQKLGVDYIADTKKPYSIGFKTALAKYEEKYHEKLKKSEMAHVGNYLINDIKGGNIFGITTCLVRRTGKLSHVGAGMHELVGINESHIVREELKARELWHKYRQYENGDQYYQLGEEPGYKKLLKALRSCGL